MHQKARNIFISLLIAASAMSADASLIVQHAPVTARSTETAYLLRARDMARLGNYAGCVDQLNHIATERIPLDEEGRQEFLYLLGTAGYELDDSRCTVILQHYLADYPATADARHARLNLGDYHYFAHQWEDALDAYESVDIDALDAGTRARYRYRKALCLICLDRPGEARPLLKQLTSDKEFATAASYYDAYIDYTEGRDSQALAKFLRISEKIGETEDSRQYAGMAPGYYIAQILFRQGRYEECVKTALNLLRRDSQPELSADTRRVLGLSYFELGDLTSARGSLESYVTRTGADATPDAVYALGACEYAAGDLRRAADRFSLVADREDAIGQGACLYLGQIEAAQDNPSAAAIYFEKAYRAGYDPKVSETALYNYVAARSEGGGVPFDSSVELLRRFIDSFPDSEYAPAIERHLASLCYSRGDYDAALEAIDGIRHPDSQDRLMLQKILYGAGTSALSSGQTSRARGLLQRCVDVKGGDPSISCQANIWLGDALYASGQYGAAEKAYTAASGSGRAGDNAALLQYDLGYTLLMQDKFSRAAAAFRKALDTKPSLTAEMRRDTEMRLADCKYYSGDYTGAMADFSRLRREGTDADYAIYRHAQMLGLTGDLRGKIAELESLARDYPDSPRMSDVMTELADTYAAAGDNAKAAEAYSRILTRYPVASGAPKAALGMASALMAQGKEDEAAEAYRSLMLKWSASDEAKTADRELRQHYARTHNLTEYAAFIKNVPGFSLDAAQLDDLAYETAENDYLDNPSSIRPIQDYITRYPAGRHLAEAYSIFADYLYDTGDKERAYTGYMELERRGGREFAARAYTGIMRTAPDDNTRLEYARKVRNLGGVSADALEEASLYEATALLTTGNAAEKREARQSLRRLAANPHSAAGARSAVTLAEDLLSQGDAESARDMMEDFTGSGSPQQYWVARGFITLADAYTALGKDYLAKEYLTSLRDNYPGDEADIREMITIRLTGTSSKKQTRK